MEEIGDQSLTVALFDRFPIRRTWHNGEWFYSLVDIVAALAATPIPRRYWSDLKKQLNVMGSQVYASIVQLPLPAPDGKMRKTDCANRETVLRIIQSIPSPNAEPFKQWLANVGALALEEQEETEQIKSLRAEHRLKLYALDTLLHEIVTFRGITTPEQHERLSDSNYSGLYNTATRERLIHERRLPFGATLEEFMG